MFFAAKTSGCAHVCEQEREVGLCLPVVTVTLWFDLRNGSFHREAAARERALMGSRQMEKSILAATAKRETLRSSSSSLTSTGSTRPHTVASIRKFTSSTPLSPMFSPLKSTASTFDELDDEDLRDSVYAHKTTAFRPRSEELKHLVLLPDFHNHRTPFVGGDVVLAKCRCSLGDGDSRTLYPGSTLVSPTRRPTSVDTPVEPSSDEAGVETKVADDEDGIVEDATLRSEVWDISVIERGLLSSTQVTVPAVETLNDGLVMSWLCRVHDRTTA
jgi:hypothetical protein